MRCQRPKDISVRLEALALRKVASRNATTLMGHTVLDYEDGYLCTIRSQFRTVAHIRHPKGQKIFNSERYPSYSTEVTNGKKVFTTYVIKYQLFTRANPVHNFWLQINSFCTAISFQLMLYRSVIQSLLPMRHPYEHQRCEKCINDAFISDTCKQVALLRILRKPCPLAQSVEPVGILVQNTQCTERNCSCEIAKDFLLEQMADRNHLNDVIQTQRRRIQRLIMLNQLSRECL